MMKKCAGYSKIIDVSNSACFEDGRHACVSNHVIMKHENCFFFAVLVLGIYFALSILMIIIGKLFHITAECVVSSSCFRFSVLLNVDVRDFKN